MSNILLSPLSIAPMIDWTYSHFRVFMRILAPHALLYTEMQTTGAIQNNPVRALQFSEREHPIALQLGGSDPKALAQCAQYAEQEGYDEVNLNLGCPSDKVQAGHFGACLMREPKQVVACIQAMLQEATIPVTAKTRIGIDHQDSYEFFSDFVHQLLEAGVQKVIVHARKAWLNGLNPKQNRTIPPINYEYVYRLKKEIPDVPVVVNGNISNIEEINDHLQYVEGVMLGRLACDNPFQIAKIHQALYPETQTSTRSEVFNRYLDYLYGEYTKGVSLSLLIKPVFNLAFGLPGASQWKRKLMLILQTKNLSLFRELGEYLQEIEMHAETS
ncbi:tRNA dihydrouridine(20/20a) synthase DusA [Legionella qingyii]|uniref:tRNA-dihydrouridine(20/20a) synthase n=1 Tax=Legionella qingyii TaxID=2184757 RepID=A0A317U0R1_9GAMM|nr:tRNA dihydrouridine(20/20a) synthase DusA [Legionella qingyii]PWY54387.1 tRNA dihydrouridine(20/20a) synthase DusA [Legionella qingyii]RUR22836.1 tRNA dihydrouridine(20/20a) synthase DusA [Legionella qingyii]RUR23015.1 tRNA dihydrouridine(20/20a) synthase DusA [Legionella qingyii]